MSRLSLLSLSLLALLLFVGGCGRVDPSNPYDPDTPADQQHRAALIGQVSVQEGAISEILRQTTITLEGVDNGELYRVGVRQDGRFRFDDVLSGHYLLGAEIESEENYQLLETFDLVLEPLEQRSLIQPLIILRDEAP